MRRKIILRAISICVIASLFLNGAGPAAALQIPLKCRTLTTTDDYKNRIQFEVMELLSVHPDALTIKTRFTPRIDGQTELVIDFSNPHQEGDNCVIPCSANDPARNYKRTFEAIIPPAGAADRVVTVREVSVILINPNRGSTFGSIKPLGLARISANLKSYGIGLKFIDATREEMGAQKLAESVTKLKHDLGGRVVVGIGFLPGDGDYVKDFLSKLPPDIKGSEDLTIAAGGYFPTISTEELFKNFPDIRVAVLGEGDYAFPEAVRRIVNGEELRGVNNIFYRDRATGAVIPNPHRVLTTEDLDRLPPPDWDILISEKDKFYKKALIDTAHGCMGICSFCGISGFFKPATSRNRVAEKVPLKDLMWRPRSPKKVIDEIEYLYKRYNITGFDIVDDDFIGNNPERAKEIANEILQRKLKINFWILTRTRSVIPESRTDEPPEKYARRKELIIKAINRLKEAGLRLVFLGTESMEEGQLRFYRKQTSVEENREAIKLFQERHIDVRAGFINFYRESTLPQIRKNIDGIKKLGLEAWIPTPTSALRIYPKTLLYEQYKREGIPLIPISKDAYTCDFVNQDVKRLYEWTKPLADRSYPLMVHFRELQEMKYYAPSELSEKAEKTYVELKKLEFSFFNHVLVLMERVGGTMPTAAMEEKMRNVAEAYFVDMCEIVRGFNEWVAGSAYDASFQMLDTNIIKNPLTRMRDVLERDQDAWIAFGDFRMLWDRNNTYGHEVMDYIINEVISITDAVAKQYGGFAEHLVADEVVITIPIKYGGKIYAKKDIEDILQAIKSEIDAKFQDQFGFALLDITGDEKAILGALENNPKVKELSKLSVVEPSGAENKKWFVIFKKDPSQGGNEALHELLAPLGDLVSGKIDFPFMVPWLPMGATRASLVRTGQEQTMDEWVSEILKETFSIQDPAKTNPKMFKVEQDRSLTQTIKMRRHTTSMMQAPSGWKIAMHPIIAMAARIRNIIKSLHYSTERTYPSFRQHTLKTILRDQIYHAGKEVALYKISPNYETNERANPDIYMSLMHGRGSREFRLSDKGARRFGFKSVEYAYDDHTLGDEIIALINVAIDKEFREGLSGFTVNIIRGPPETFYLVVAKDTEADFPSAEELLTKLGAVKKMVDEKLGLLKLSSHFELSSVLYKDVRSRDDSESKTLIEEMVDTVNMVAQSRKIVPRSTLDGNVVKDYRNVRDMPRELEKETTRTEAYLRKYSKQNLLLLDWKNKRKPLFLLLGYPGSGKGDVGAMLSAHTDLNMPFVSLGELLQTEIRQDPASYIVQESAGIFALLERRIRELLYAKLDPDVSKVPVDNGIIIDANAPVERWKEHFEDFMQNNGFYLAGIINVNVSPETAVRRMAVARPQGDFKSEARGAIHPTHEEKARADLLADLYRQNVLSLLDGYRHGPRAVPIIEVDNEDSPKQDAADHMREEAARAAQTMKEAISGISGRYEAAPGKDAETKPPDKANRKKEEPLELPDEAILKNLSDQGEMARQLCDEILSLLLTKKVVLAFDDGLHCKAVIAVIKALKDDGRFKDLLKNLEIIKAPVARLAPRLEERIRDGAEVFVFARQSKRNKLKSVEGRAHAAYISEGSFSPYSYYPLLEIVTITLAGYKDGHVIKEALKIAKALNIKAITKNKGAFRFVLLPSAERYSIRELAERYGRLKELLSNA